MNTCFACSHPATTEVVDTDNTTKPACEMHHSMVLAQGGHPPVA